MNRKEFQNYWCKTDAFARLFDQPYKEKELWLCIGIVRLVESDYRSAYGNYDLSYFNVPGWDERFDKMQLLKWDYRLEGQWQPDDNQPKLEAEIKGLLESGDITADAYVRYFNAIQEAVQSGKISKTEPVETGHGHLPFI